MDAYSGTTLQNYRTCGRLHRGKVHFVKALESKHEFPEMHYADSLETAAYFALTSAREIEGHLPAIFLEKSQNQNHLMN